MGNEAMDNRALDEFLNDLAAGKATGMRDDLDRSLLETMLELRSLAQMPLAKSTRERVDTQIESAIGLRTREMREDVPGSQSVSTNVFPRRIFSNGHDATFGTRVGALSAPRSRRRVPRALTWFAA